MKKSIITLLHVGFWACFVFLIFLFVGAIAASERDSSNNDYVMVIGLFTGMAIIPAFISFYGNYSILFTRYLKTRKFKQFIIGNVIAIACSAILGTLTIIVVIGLKMTFAAGLRGAIFLPAITSIVAVLSGTVGLVIKGFVTWYSEMKMREELQQKNHETEMALVKAQMNPHFLFNTLNNIDVLILKDTEKASNYLNKLSDILRFSLYETKSDSIPLKQELEYVEKYIELQRIRSANPDYIQMNVNGSSDYINIAPMLFIPFLENAFKHVSAKTKEGSVQINLDLKPSKLKFEVKNRYDEKTMEIDHSYKGLGNELIAKRIELLYGNRQKLKTSKSNGVYSVELSVELS